MTDTESDVQLLPPGTGARPWLPPEPVSVPVVVAGDYKNVIGLVRVRAGDDGALMGDVTFREGVSKDDYVLEFGVDGEIVEERTVEGKRIIERVRLNCVAVAPKQRPRR